MTKAPLTTYKLLLTCRYYNSKVRKSPHVVGHYAAGARLIGLTEKQMAKRLATLSVTGGENNDSPYAQPLCMFTTNIPTNIFGKRRRTRTHGKIRLTVVKHGETQEEEGEGGLDEEGQSGLETPLANVSAVQKNACVLIVIITGYTCILRLIPQMPKSLPLYRPVQPKRGSSSALRSLV